MFITSSLSLEEKLNILTDAAKYDVACTSSGSTKKGISNGMGNTLASGICHSFSADGRCISLLKILFTNECIFDCKYCINRSSNDVIRTSFTPEEVCHLTLEFYKRNYIEGLFLSSGIVSSPNHTMELLYETLHLLRNVHHFNGYIHVKAIPGADDSLIQKTGWLADRMSINLELPTASGLKLLAPHKSRQNILRPMRQIQLGIKEQSLSHSYIDSSSNTIINNNTNIDISATNAIDTNLTNNNRFSVYNSNTSVSNNSTILSPIKNGIRTKSFVPAGQSTQMIIGATNENDYQILSVAESLYNNFDLKRVFYSAFIKVNDDSLLPTIPGGPPLLREHRLYQSDWLLRFYGFKANELLSEHKPNFNVLLDPKSDWAVSHLEHFPVEINKADYYTLLRVPGIGPKSASRIVKARRHSILSFNDLKKIGIVLKRSIYFITCNGQMMYPIKFEEHSIINNLLSLNKPISNENNYEQLSLFNSDGQLNSLA